MNTKFNISYLNQDGKVLVERLDSETRKREEETILFSKVFIGEKTVDIFSCLKNKEMPLGIPTKNIIEKIYNIGKENIAKQGL